MKQKTNFVKDGDQNILCLFLGMEKIKTCGPKPCKRVNNFLYKQSLGYCQNVVYKKREKKNSDSDTILAEILC